MGSLDPESLGRLIDEQASALELYARQWCDSPEDVVQEAFLKLCRQPRPPDRPVAWLFRVVRNEAITAARKSRIRRRHETSRKENSKWFAEAAQTGLDPAAASEALAGLPLEQREVIVAHLWGKLTFEQIAEIMNTSSSGAHRHYQSGLAALRERLCVECSTTNAPRKTT